MHSLRVILFLAFIAEAGRGQAADDRHQLLGKVLTPFLALFAEDNASGDRALTLQARIEQMTDLPPELKGASAELSVQTPNQLRLHAPLLGEEMTLVRDGARVWITPGARAKALLSGLDKARQLPKADKKFELGDFELPIPANQLVFLPMLFSIKDVGRESFGGEECRVLDVQLMPELARSLDVGDWTARLWIRPDATPARVTLARHSWNMVVRIERVEFSPKLPGSTWKPTEAEAGDVLELTPKEYGRFLSGLTGTTKKPKAPK